ncbi:MAG: hypothetical protein IKN85_07075 [Oscillospiraceae bacterium]|nr:hypothetical protein [Oscillospiraceae bacterium]MBR3535573.1 hypothetical protein [Oscillospiraceae bacterium]MBR6835763.1 hypothetical protein [Oscillospiraceae bacterium]
MSIKKYIVIIGSLLLGALIFRISSVNSISNQRIVHDYDSGEKFYYNGITMNTEKITFKKADNSDVFWNTIKNRSDNTYVVMVGMKMINENNEKVYLDFSSFYLSMGYWFSNMDIDVFKQINPIVKDNIRICMEPGAEADFMIPFFIYFSNDKEDPVNKFIASESEVVLSVGLYPVKHNIYLGINSNGEIV